MKYHHFIKDGRPCGNTCLCGKVEPHAIHHNTKYPHKDPREK